MRVSLVTILTLASVCISSSITAQAPSSLSFQGLLSDSLGNPVDSTGVGMTFTLYKGNSAVWTEPQSVDVEGGVFNVLLGEVTDLSTLAFDQPMDLGVKLDNEASEMSPRTPLAAAAFAKALPGLYTFYRENQFDQSYNVIGGAANNVVGATVIGATIGGGGRSGPSPFPNSVLASFSVVGGGSSNTASGESAAVGGGFSNTASGGRATVGGGSSNIASGSVATVGGGIANKATGKWATVPGGLANRARGVASFAAGFSARAIHHGTFVWNDRSIF
ncbi:MAG: hypothetical protein ACC655_01420, partial [Rhodothermia bacterium]